VVEPHLGQVLVDQSGPVGAQPEVDVAAADDEGLVEAAERAVGAIRLGS